MWPLAVPLQNRSIEPLICNIKHSLLFKGVSIARKPLEEKVIAFADETTVLVWEEFSVHEP
jgi:hypothetical protein